MAAQPDVNLLPKSEFESSFWGKFLKWSLTAGRYIIILTEMVVIGAFLSRFKLDKDLSDLTESINGKKAILEALASTEKNFRKTQSNLEIAQKAIDISPKALDLWNETVQTIPPEIILTTASFSNKELNLQATAPEHTSMGSLLQTLTQNKRWKSVELNQINADSTQGVKFTIKIVI